ncbi:hypothetical protein ACEPAG_7466 [Sanghuangporus baumii]
MKCPTETFFRFFIAWFCITLSSLPFALCTNNLSTPIGEVVIYATDPRIQYDPPLDSASGVWSPLRVPHLGHNASQTSDPSAKVSLVFQGTSVCLYAVGSPGFPPLSFNLDNSSTAVQTNQSARILKISLGASGLDPSANHTIVVQKKLDSNSGSLWNILAFGITVPPSSSIAPPSPIPVIPDMSTATGTNASMKHEDGSRTLPGGTIAGIVVAILSGIGFAIVLSFCIRRRHNKMSDVAPEPLVILPEPPRRDLSRFHRLYLDRLPHFTAPTSVWPSSVIHASTIDQHELPHAHGSLREKTRSFSVPVPSPLIVKPSPPKRRQPTFSGFFVANPSSHSSRSVRSVSLKDSRVRSDRMPTKATNLDLLASDGAKLETGLLNEKESDPARVGKGKQRAVDFEIDPALPERPRVVRKQSLRRFFFTTNPNPSTTSSSSTSSLGRSTTARTAAVADYVRDQIRRHRKAQQGTPQPPKSTRAAALPSITTPEKISPRITPVAPEPNPVLQESKKSRTSQTLFFTTNPSPSIPDSNNGRAEAESMLSDIPPPRKDKGKGRAF